MQIRRFSTFLTLVLFSIVLLSNTFAQDYTQWELPEGAIARLGKGGIHKIQYSPDNRFFAVAGTIGIWIYDTVGRQKPANTRKHSYASGSGDETICLWDVATGKHRVTFTPFAGTVFSVVFSPDGRTLASGNDNDTVHLWDVDTGKQIKILTGHSRRIWQVAFSPDGRTLASGSGDGTVLLWELMAR